MKAVGTVLLRFYTNYVTVRGYSVNRSLLQTGQSTHSRNTVAQTVPAEIFISCRIN